MTPHDPPGAEDPPDDSEEPPGDFGQPSGDSEESADDTSALLDATFAALSDARRRHALYYLRDRESATLDELATVLAGWLNAREDGAGVATPDDRERVRAQLHHAQLPNLSAAGFVRYDLDSGEVALADLPEFTEAALARSLATDRQRARAKKRDQRGWRDTSNHGYT